MSIYLTELLWRTIPSGVLLVVYDIIVIGTTLKLISLNCLHTGLLMGSLVVDFLVVGPLV